MRKDFILEYLTENRIVVFYNNGFIRSSDDGGESWVLDSLGINRRVLDLEFIDDKYGLILWNLSLANMRTVNECQITTNGGVNWSDLTIPIDSLFNKEIYLSINSVNFISEHEIFINTSILDFKNYSIYDYEVYRLLTTDLGSTWEKKLLLKGDNVNSRNQKSQQYIISIFQFLSKKIGYWIGATPSQIKEDVVGNVWHYPFLKKTTDGGESWRTLFHDKNSSNRSRTALDIIDKQENDNLILKGNPTGILLYNKGESFFRNVFTKNYSALNQEYGYKSITDFLRLDSDRIMVAAGSEYIFYIYYKNPISSVEGLFSQSEIEIYPNPIARSQPINLKFDPIVLDVATVSIIDISGRVVSSYKVNFTSSNETLELKPENNLPSGVYFLQIGYSNGIAERQKFVVE